MSSTPDERLASFIGHYDPRRYGYLLRIARHGMSEAIRRGYDSRESYEVLIAMHQQNAFYTQLFIGAISGYFPGDLSNSLIDEIIRFYELPHVKNYLIEERASLWPEINIAYAISVKVGIEKAFISSSVDTPMEFVELLTFRNSINKNVRISKFREITDGFSSVPVSESVGLFLELVNKEGANVEEKNALKDKIIGAFEFYIAISEFSQIVRRLSDEMPVLSSAYWHYYSYYFDRRSIELNGIFKDLKSVFIPSLMYQVNDSVKINGIDSNSFEYHLMRQLDDIEVELNYLMSVSLHSYALQKIKDRINLEAGILV